MSLCGPGVGLAFGLCSWVLYLKVVGRPAPAVAIFLLAALGWAAAWEFARGSAAERAVQASLASALAVELLGHAAFFLPGFLTSFLHGTALAVLFCLCCGADRTRRRFSFADALAGAATLALGAAAAASGMGVGLARGPSWLGLEETLGLAVASGGCALIAWGSVLYLTRELELGFTLGTEYALSAAAGYATAALLQSPGVVALIVVCTAAPAVLLAISGGLRRLGKWRADRAMEGGEK